MTAQAVRVPRKRNENIPEVAVKVIGRVFDGKQDYAPECDVEREGVHPVETKPSGTCVASVGG
jgi:hypothetical protein